MTVLTGEQFEQLQHLLTEALDKHAIKELVRKRLGRRLDTILNPDQSAREIVFELLTWVDQRGLNTLEVVLQGVLAERPGDGALRAFCEQIVPGALKPADTQPSVLDLTSGAPQPFIGVPPRIASFTGRAEELQRLDDILMQEKPAAVTQGSFGRVAVQGMGGVGKTALAIEYAHRFRGLYAGVCWCPAETHTGLLTALAGLAVTLGAAAAEEANVEKAANAALRRLAEQRVTWLLVYDNVAALVAIYPADGYDNPKSWPLCTRLTPHLLAREGARHEATPRIADWSDLLNRAGRFFHGRAAYPHAASLYRDAVAICEKGLGPEHPDTATSLSILANLLHAQGDMAAARPLHKRALAIREKVLGPEHPDTAVSLINLAMTLTAQGDFAGARPLSERALMISEKVLGPEHPITAISLNSLAYLLQAQGNLAAARPRYERALMISEKVLGPEHHDTATRLSSLAYLLQAQGNLAAARTLYERALAINEKVLGPEHPTTANDLYNLGHLLQAQGGLAGARPLYERALAIYENAFGPEHRNTNRTRNHLARLLLTSGQPSEALALSETAVTAHDKVLGRDHAWTKDSARVTADALDALGRSDEAAALREKYGVTPEAPSTS